MQFPILHSISSVPFGFGRTATLLKVDGNAGQIPPSFQYAVTTADGAVCLQGISQLSSAQWDKWSDAHSDEDYVLACVADNIGATLDDEANTARLEAEKPVEVVEVPAQVVEVSPEVVEVPAQVVEVSPEVVEVPAPVVE